MAPDPDPRAHALRQVGDDAFVWLADEPGHGRTNVGVILDDDGITVVDCLLTPGRSAAVATELEGFGRPVRRAVYTSSHVEFVGGSASFWMAARYGRSQTSALLDQPPSTSVWRHLYPDDAEAFDDEFSTRPVSHTVDQAAWISQTACLVPTTGQQRENLVVLDPEADVLFAGAMCSFGVTPNCFDGDPLAWADSLGELADLATTIVPGIGPVGEPGHVVALQAYLYACADAEGDVAAIPDGPWSAWRDRHLDAVNVERAAMLAAGDAGVPPSMLRLAGLA